MENHRSRMLEVSVSRLELLPRWEWEVRSNGEVLTNGFEEGELEARFEGYKTPVSS
jgi:hypothetical protein